ncbi:EamA family transporter [Bathymodiolus thermophilus thioautotrophic gill symbiont]|uniref:EamA family transporter n=2 Tax=Bathymodiolus thermophilus thioautotrophic gill symbiont TaxID=2360 RepID=A0A3G3IKV8_9GAMM|nr:EamA family transporter [Bathymodiolus thermophilus thioautotrophic gill symbiont]
MHIMSANQQQFLWLILAMFFWGASWPIASIMSAYVDVHEFITYRYFFVTLSMAPVLWWMRLSFKIGFIDFVIACIAALFLVLYSNYYFLSVTHGAPGLAGAVVTTLMPILVYLLMLFSKQKKPRFKDWLALLLAAIGVLITMGIWQFQLSEILATGNLYMIAASLSWALVSITSSYAKPLNPLVLSFYIYLITTILDWLLFFQPTHGSVFAMDGIFWINFVIVSLGSTTFATTIYFASVHSLGSKKASVFTFLVPFFALGTSVLFLNETLQWTTFLGVLMTIIALIVLNDIKLRPLNKHK